MSKVTKEQAHLARHELFSQSAGEPIELMTNGRANRILDAYIEQSQPVLVKNTQHDVLNAWFIAGRDVREAYSAGWNACVDAMLAAVKEES